MIIEKTSTFTSCANHSHTFLSEHPDSNQRIHPTKNVGWVMLALQAHIRLHTVIINSRQTTRTTKPIVTLQPDSATHAMPPIQLIVPITDESFMLSPMFFLNAQPFHSLIFLLVLLTFWTLAPLPRIIVRLVAARTAHRLPPYNSCSIATTTNFCTRAP